VAELEYNTIQKGTLPWQYKVDSNGHFYCVSGSLSCYTTLSEFTYFQSFFVFRKLELKTIFFIIFRTVVLTRYFLCGTVNKTNCHCFSPHVFLA